MSEATAETLALAEAAMNCYARGLATGEWEEFLNYLTDDFTFSFPVPPFQGENKGKAKAADFFRYVSTTVFPDGLTLTIQRRTSNGNTVIFEAESQGKIGDLPYQNQVAIAFDARGDKICSYREYLAVIYKR
jgi:limonene-1,2-epoxide hydrolase